MDSAPMGMIDEAVRLEAAPLLGDLSAWRLSDRQWTVVYDVLCAMSAAVVDDSADALRHTVRDLEVLSPPRITPLGAVPVGPPPAVLVLRDRLVHDLGVESARPQGSPAGVAVGSIPVATVTRHAFVA